MRVGWAPCLWVSGGRKPMPCRAVWTRMRGAENIARGGRVLGKDESGRRGRVQGIGIEGTFFFFS